MWELSHRADDAARRIADRHYNRQKIGSPQFVPPGRCIVLLSTCENNRYVGNALWVTSWPFAEYVKHAWAGAWVNSCFRKERDGKASEMIRDAIAVTRHFWEPPKIGIITFVNEKHVKPTWVRGNAVYGYSYKRAGFDHVGYTGGGLWAWQMMPDMMPRPQPPYARQTNLFAPAPV